MLGHGVGCKRGPPEAQVATKLGPFCLWGSALCKVLTGEARSKTQCVYVCRQREGERVGRGVCGVGWGLPETTLATIPKGSAWFLLERQNSIVHAIPRPALKFLLACGVLWGYVRVCGGGGSKAVFT